MHRSASSTASRTASRTASSTLRCGGSAALALGLVGASVVLTAGPSQAAGRDDHRFSLKGTAYPQLYSVTNDSLPASPTQSAASAVASSTLTSVGDSFAFAAAPYYGSTATTAPSLAAGLAAGLAGQQFDLPVKSLPGLIQSRYPGSTSAAEDAGGYKVRAVSDQYSSSASGSNGAPGDVAPNQQQSATSTTTANADGSTVVKAVGRTAGLTLGPLNGITVTGEATITDKDSAPVVTSTSGGSFGIAGVQVQFDDKGFSVVGQGGQQAKDTLAMINKTLAAQRMKIETDLSTRTLDKSTGELTTTVAALRITSTQNIPETGLGAATADIDIPVYSGGVPAPTGDATVVYTFGYAQVTSQNSAFAADAVPPTGTTDDPTTGTTGDPGTGSTGDPSTGTTGTDTPGVIPVSDLDDLIAAGPSADGLPSVTTDVEGDVPASSSSDDVLGLAPTSAYTSNSSQLLYLVLVLGGAALFAGQQLFSRFGLRLALTTR